MERGRAPSTSSRRGYAAASVAVLVWSFTGILVRYLLQSRPITPTALVFWRDLVSAGTLLAVLTAARPAALRAEKRHRPFLVLFGVTLALLNVTWTWSVAWNGAAVSTVLVYSSPAVTAIFARLFLKERLGPTRLVALAASLTGCVLVAKVNDPSCWHLNGPGIFAGILSAVAFAAFSLMGKVASSRGVDPWTATLYSFALAALFVLPLASVSSPASGAGSSLLSLGTRWDGWMLLLLLVVPTLGGYGLYTVSLGHLPAATANVIATLEPVLTTVWAHLLLGETLDRAQTFGGALIVLSILFLQLEPLGRRGQAGATVPLDPAQP